MGDILNETLLIERAAATLADGLRSDLLALERDADRLAGRIRALTRENEVLLAENARLKLATATLGAPSAPPALPPVEAETAEPESAEPEPATA